MTAATEIPRTIAVVQLGRLGDMILTTPLLRALEALYPLTRITVIASPDAAAIASHHSCVDDVMEVSRGAVGLAGAMIRLRLRAFDLYIDPKDHPSSTSRALARATRAIAGIVHASNARAGFAALPPAREPGHFVDRMLAPVDGLVPSASHDRRPRLDIPSQHTVESARIRSIVGNDYAVVNISAGAALRTPSFGQVSEVLRWLSSALPVVIVSAPGDRAAARSLSTLTARVVAADTPHPLSMAAVVAGAALALTPDTAVVHVASAFDVPTVAMYPCDNDNHRLFAPLATRHQSLFAPERGTISDIPPIDITRALEVLLASR